MNRPVVAGMCYVQAILLAGAAVSQDCFIVAVAVALMYAIAGWALFRRVPKSREMGLGLGALEILLGLGYIALGLVALALGSEPPETLLALAIGAFEAGLGGFKIRVLTRAEVRREFLSLGPTEASPE